MLSKRKDKKRNFVHISTEKTEYNLPKATPESLRKISERMIQENKNRQIKRLMVLGVASAILLLLVIYLSSHPF